MNDNIASFAYGAIKALIESAPGKVKQVRKRKVVAKVPGPTQVTIPFPDLSVPGNNPFDTQPLQENTKLKDIPVTLRDTVNPEMYHPSRETDSSGTQDTIPWMSR